MLLQCGANPNSAIGSNTSNGHTAVRMAAYNSHIKTLRLLLLSGGDACRAEGDKMLPIRSAEAVTLLNEAQPSTAMVIKGVSRRLDRRSTIIDSHTFTEAQRRHTRRQHGHLG